MGFFELEIFSHIKEGVLCVGCLVASCDDLVDVGEGHVFQKGVFFHFGQRELWYAWSSIL